MASSAPRNPERGGERPQLPPLVVWLAAAALADWLIARTLSRAAIYIPKSPLVVSIYQAVTLAGQVAFTLTGLLALAAVLWLAWWRWRGRGELALPLILLGLLVFGLVGVFVPSGGLPSVGYHALVLAAAGWIAAEAWRAPGSMDKKIALAFPALAIAAGALYQLLPALDAAWRLPGRTPLPLILFYLGEASVALSPIALWWAFGRATPGRTRVAPYLWAALPAAAFAAFHTANPSMTSIIAIWSTGLALYLPWPLYALGIWLAGVTVLVALGRRDPVGWAIILLAAGGYAPQLSTQVILGLIALQWVAWADGGRPRPASSRAGSLDAAGEAASAPGAL